jgi:hypothetical protein
VRDGDNGADDDGDNCRLSVTLGPGDDRIPYTQ